MEIVLNHVCLVGVITLIETKEMNSWQSGILVQPISSIVVPRFCANGEIRPEHWSVLSVGSVPELAVSQSTESERM